MEWHEYGGFSGERERLHWFALMLSAAFLVLVLALPPRVAPDAFPDVFPDEFSERFAQLASPRAEERTAAERWLAAHLVLARYAELAESALAGDAE
ncbi:MAG: hypothetical protein HOP15_02680, partial [Planctomycetes bacterium]|nr:hypothetical protein [Planctomycetota bacterium]